MDKQNISLELSDPLSPCLIKEEGDEHYKCVVMPMRCRVHRRARNFNEAYRR